MWQRHQGKKNCSCLRTCGKKKKRNMVFKWDPKNIVLFKKINKPMEHLCYFLWNLYMEKDKIVLFILWVWNVWGQNGRYCKLQYYIGFFFFFFFGGGRGDMTPPTSYCEIKWLRIIWCFSPSMVAISHLFLF